jgi:hypothetical protein
MIRIAIAMKGVEEEFKTRVGDLFTGGKEYKKRNNNPLLKKMEQGQADEKYVQQYYEILKKADEVVRSTNPDKAAKMADKYGVNIGAKDKWGVRWDHHGFLDPKHKHYGKTLKEIRDLEIQERKHDEDNYPIATMFSNKAELSFVQATKMLKDENEEFFIPELHEMAKMKKFPLMIVRKVDALNKIEQLVEFVHIKSVTSKHYIIEMFISTKFGLDKHDNGSDVFKELINIEQIWFDDDYGDKHAYRVTSFYKRGKHNEYIDEKKEKNFKYDVLKFKGEIIEEYKVGGK